MRCLDGITDSMDMSLSKFQDSEGQGSLQSMGSKRVEHNCETDKGDQSWVFIGRTDVEADTPILWPPDAKS